jgi:hypothetical protein
VIAGTNANASTSAGRALFSSKSVCADEINVSV